MAYSPTVLEIDATARLPGEQRNRVGADVRLVCGELHPDLGPGAIPPSSAGPGPHCRVILLAATTGEVVDIQESDFDALLRGAELGGATEPNERVPGEEGYTHCNQLHAPLMRRPVAASIRSRQEPTRSLIPSLSEASAERCSSTIAALIRAASPWRVPDFLPASASKGARASTSATPASRLFAQPLRIWGDLPVGRAPPPPGFLEMRKPGSRAPGPSIYPSRAADQVRADL